MPSVDLTMSGDVSSRQVNDTISTNCTGTKTQLQVLKRPPSPTEAANQSEELHAITYLRTTLV